MAGAKPNCGSGVRTDNKCAGKLEARTILQTQWNTITQFTALLNVGDDTEKKSSAERTVMW